LSQAPNIGFAEFYDSGHKPFGTTLPDDAKASMIVLDRDIKDATGATVGYFSIGYKKDALFAIERKLGASLILGIVVLLLIVGMTLTVSVRTFTRPLHKMIESVDLLERGDTAKPVPETERRDELGPLAQALERWRTSLIATTEQQKREQADLMQRDQRRQAIEAMTQTFEKSIVGLLGKMKVSVQDLHASADNLKINAEHTHKLSANVLTATAKATSNVQVVSAAGTELAASVNEISRQVQMSAATAAGAAKEAESANVKMAALNNATQKIGEIVSLISSIAGQTNLLALNATIESARAGEAGKGFAVVANEVKNLAGQTSHATEDISAQIGSVQTETRSAVQTLQDIAGVINKLSEMATAIAGAVEEQNAATLEITRNVELAAQSTLEVKQNIEGVTDSAGETGEMAQRVFNAANDMLTESENLGQTVERFLLNVRKT
jgi:methyl-accepting chemotaxis protein